jgi:hypothetical protein
MNICINYYGQPRKLVDCLRVFNDTISDSRYNIKICYTTWIDEDISEFKDLFPTAFIRQVNRPPSIDSITKFSMDRSNPNKSVIHYGLGLYIKQQSKQTIIDYEQQLNIKFDIVVQARTDAYVWKDTLIKYYDNVVKDVIYVGSEPRFDIYNTGAVPDVLYFGTRDTILSTLDHLDVVSNTVVKDSGYFHPETSLYNLFVYLGFKVYYCSFNAFPYKS